MGLKIVGVKSTQFRLNNVVQKTNRAVYSLLEQAAKEAKRRAELQAHLDTGALEKAFRIRRLSRAGAGGRTVFEVFIDPNARRNQRTRNGIRRQRVITYAKRLESGEFKGLGRKSREKDQRVRNTDPNLSVGSGFMARSMNYVEAVYRRRIERAVSQIMNRG